MSNAQNAGSGWARAQTIRAHRGVGAAVSISGSPPDCGRTGIATVRRVNYKVFID